VYDRGRKADRKAITPFANLHSTPSHIQSTTYVLVDLLGKCETARHLPIRLNSTSAMRLLEIIAEVQNLAEDEKRQLLELLECDLCNCANDESPEFLAMLETRISNADKGGRTYTLAQARDALRNFMRRPGG